MAVNSERDLVQTVIELGCAEREEEMALSSNFLFISFIRNIYNLNHTIS